MTIYNVEEYIQLTVDMTVGRGVEAQAAAFRNGFNCVFSIQDLAGFRSEELVRLFGSGDEDWSYESKLHFLLLFYAVQDQRFIIQRTKG